MQDLTQPSSSGDLSINPFRDDVFSPQSPIPGTPQIHQDEMTHCVQAIEKMVATADSLAPNQAHGELISISSPLAGYGKSHLISRISKTMLNSVSTIELSFGSRISWQDLLAVTLHSLDSTGSQSRVNSSLLDESAANYLANLIGTAVAQGIIEERDCPIPLANLQNDYCAAFSEGARSKLLVWLKKKSSTIRSSVKLSATEYAGFSKEDVAFWADYFLNHFRRDENGFDSLGDISETESRDRFLQLLKIASNCRPLLIIADHLDQHHGSQTAGMEIASALTSIVENVSNCVLIISMNRDLWESVFENKLPSALLDRLSGESLELSPIEVAEARELVVNRLCSNGITYHQSHQFANVVSEDCEWTKAEALFPRRILRQAREIWEVRGHDYCQPAPEESAAAQETAIFQSSEADFPQPATPGPLYTELKATPDLPHPGPAINPFESHSMVYSDRPSPVAPIPQPTDSGTTRNPYSNPDPVGITPLEAPNNLQAGRVGVEPLPQSGEHPQTHPAAQHKDEPVTWPPASVSGVNGKPVDGTNGHAANKQPQIEVKIPARTTKEPTPSPLEVYFDQLSGHYEKKADQLEINFPTWELFIKTVGENHSPLTQTEITVPGGQSVCLRWDLSNYSVWIGFEPARNIYFYNNVLQKLLSDPATPGKIVCFSHSSHPFSHELLTTNGITGDLLKRYFDFIQLSNDELVLIYSASQFLRETTKKGYQEEALKFILKKLNPLWQRLCQPLDQSAI